MRRGLLGLIVLLWTAAAAASPWREGLERRIAELHPHPVRIELGRIHCPLPIPDEAQVEVLTTRPPVGVVPLLVRWKERERERQVRAHGEIRVYAPVAVARRLIPHEQAFSPENVELSERELGPRVSGGYFTSLEALRGLQAQGTLRPGTVISPAHTRAPFLVASGQLVDWIMESAALRVSARVVALQNGRHNDWIRVRNPDSRKTFTARVSGPGEVRAR